MIADIFTKIVSGLQDKMLAIRFYNDCDEESGENDIHEGFSIHHDKYEAAVAIQPRPS